MLAPRTRARLAVIVLVAAILFIMAGDGLAGYFTPDDMMNLYLAWSATPLALLHQDRPLGQALYKVVFAVVGLHPLPFRLLAFSILLANLALLYRFCLRLSSSREIAVIACLLGAYHAHLADLYYSTGSIYDLLCWLFVLSALVYYTGIRQAGRYPDLRQSAAFVMLYICALGSKEMAVVLPLYIAVYEVLFQKGFANWLRRGAWFWWLSLPLTAAYAALKLAGPRAMTTNPDYAPHFTVHAFFAGWRHYLNDLFYGAIAFNTAKVVVLFVLMLYLAVRLRRREMLFGWVVAVAGALPVIFIPPRGFFVIYLTLPGWYLYTASVLTAARDTLVRRLPGWAASFEARPEQLGLFAVVFLLLIPIHVRERAAGRDWVDRSYKSVRSVLDALDRRGPLRKGGRILFLSDPFDPGDWILSNMFRLHYRDDTLWVDRVKDHPELALQAARYDRVYVLGEDGLKQVRQY